MNSLNSSNHLMQAATGLKVAHPAGLRSAPGRMSQDFHPDASTPHRRRKLEGLKWGLAEIAAFRCLPSHLIFLGCAKCTLYPLQVEKLWDFHQITDRLQSIHRAARSGRTASWLHRVDACMDWLTVEGSSCLYRQGDEMSGFFMVLRPGKDGTNQLLLWPTPHSKERCRLRRCKSI